MANKKSLGLGTFSMIMLLALSACSQVETVDTNSTPGNNSQNDTEENETMTDSDTVKVGAILPLTGDGAAYGVPMQKIAQIAVEKVNEEGGIDGKDLEFIFEDGKCTGKDAASAAEKLINIDNVEIIYGGFCSSETLGLAPKAEAAGVVVLSPGSSSPDITDAGDYIFRNYPSDSAQGKIIAEVAGELGLQTIGVLTEEQDYTIGIESSFSESFEGEVISQNFLSTDTDFKTQIAKLKSDGVDAILVNPQTPAMTDLLFKQLQEQGIEGIQLLGNDVVLGSAEAIANYPDVAEGMIGAETTYNTEHPDYIYFTEKYLTETGEEEVPFPTYASTSFDAVRIIAEGVEEVGYDADAFKTWLYEIDGWEGSAGSLTIDENGDPEAGHKAKVVTNGQTEIY